MVCGQMVKYFFSNFFQYKINEGEKIENILKILIYWSIFSIVIKYNLESILKMEYNF
jgi:hypothetical protein